MTIIDVPLDAKARLEIASMVYSRWSLAFDSLKNTKALTWESQNRFCPKADWPFFHKSLIESAQKEFDLACKLKEDMCKYSPLVTGE
jgi:hypothetical protein